MSSQSHELATVIDHFLPAFNAKNKLPTHKLKALNALLKCRTAFMGGHLQACEDCGELRIAHNSCRNRHCPKCGAIEKEKWIMAREADLLPVKYFHVVFTVPDKLNDLFLNHQRKMYDLFFTVAWEVLSDFGKTKKWMGGKIGATAILHSWGQNLQYHPHLHFIVPAGALMPDGKWKQSRNRGKYLFKVDQLSSVFRARFMERTRDLAKKEQFVQKVPNNLFEKNWVIYAKQPFGGPKQVINYLGRYTHRTAISNNRILEVSQDTVTFTWKDYKQDYKKQVTTLKGKTFLGLFCQHILPPGYTRIRHFGFLSSASKAKSLALIRKDLGAKAPQSPKSKTWQEVVMERMGIQPGKCNSCGGKMQLIDSWPNQFRQNQRAPPEAKAA